MSGVSHNGAEGCNIGAEKEEEEEVDGGVEEKPSGTSESSSGGDWTIVPLLVVTMTECRRCKSAIVLPLDLAVTHLTGLFGDGVVGHLSVSTRLTAVLQGGPGRGRS